MFIYDSRFNHAIQYKISIIIIIIINFYYYVIMYNFQYSVLNTRHLPADSRYFCLKNTFVLPYYLRVRFPRGFLPPVFPIKTFCSDPHVLSSHPSS